LWWAPTPIMTFCGEDPAVSRRRDDIMLDPVADITDHCHYVFLDCSWKTMFGSLLNAVKRYYYAINSTTIVTLQVLFDRQTNGRVSGMYV
jgi:hypothetical protein